MALQGEAAMDPAVSEAMDAALAALEAQALQEERQHQFLLLRWSLQASVGQVPNDTRFAGVAGTYVRSSASSSISSGRLI